MSPVFKLNPHTQHPLGTATVKPPRATPPTSTRSVSLPPSMDVSLLSGRSRSTCGRSPRGISPVATPISGNAMKVYIRVRPFNEREVAQKEALHSTVRIDPQNPSLLSVLEPQHDFRPHSSYSFSRCFWSVLEEEGCTDNTASVIHRQVLTMMATSSSARGEHKEVAGAQEYFGAGSTAVITKSNVSHPPYAGQEEVYNEVGLPILEHAVDGYNGCVFAYGQTGSGKTFTMLGHTPPSDGSPRSWRVRSAISPRYGSVGEEAKQGMKKGVGCSSLQGIIPRATADLFDRLRQKRVADPSLSYRVEAAYYEVYNEKVFDLLQPQPQGLRVRHHPTNGPYVEDLSQHIVHNEGDVMEVLGRGIQERRTSATRMNDRSSRSHAILTFTILQLSLDVQANISKVQSKLNLVDLAGSERTGAIGAQGTELTDGIKINLSLTVLGRVIDGLADLSQGRCATTIIPYRDSTLTWLLSDSLGGNSQTSMIATISPHALNYEEMRQTIRYASRARQIVNRAVRNEDPQVRQLKLLSAEVERLQHIIQSKGFGTYPADYVEALEERNKELEVKLEEQRLRNAELRGRLESVEWSTRNGAPPPPPSGEQARIPAFATPTQANSGRQLCVDEKTSAAWLRLESQMFKWCQLRDRECAYMLTLAEDKETALFRAFRNALAVSYRQSGDPLHHQSAQKREAELLGQRRRLTLELEELRVNFSERERTMIAAHEAEVERALLTANEQRRTEMDHESAAWQSQLSAISVEMGKKERALRAELEEAHMKLKTSLADRQRANDVIERMENIHRAEVERMALALEEAQSSSSEHAHQRHLLEERVEKSCEIHSELENESRLVEKDLDHLRKALKEEQRLRESLVVQHQEQLCAMHENHESVLHLCESLLQDWATKSKRMEEDMARLRHLTEDDAFVQCRQRMRELAHRPPHSYSSALKVILDKNQHETQAFRDVMRQAREVQFAQLEKLHRLENEIRAHNERAVSPSATRSHSVVAGALVEHSSFASATESGILRAGTALRELSTNQGGHPKKPSVTFVLPDDAGSTAQSVPVAKERDII